MTSHKQRRLSVDNRERVYEIRSVCGPGISACLMDRPRVNGKHSLIREILSKSLFFTFSLTPRPQRPAEGEKRGDPVGSAPEDENGDVVPCICEPDLIEI